MPQRPCGWHFGWQRRSPEENRVLRIQVRTQTFPATPTNQTNPQLTWKSPRMRPVATTSSCQPGPQGPELCHRISVSVPWVSSSCSSATSVVGGPGVLRPLWCLPSLLAVPCPRTPTPSLGHPASLCSCPPSFPCPWARGTPPGLQGPAAHLQRPCGTRASAHRWGLPRVGQGSAGLQWTSLSHSECQ